MPRCNREGGASYAHAKPTCAMADFGLGVTRTVLKILAIQLAITLVAASVAMILVSFKGAYSALIGGGINILATAYFAVKVFSAKPGSPAKQIARAFYWGEVVKLLLTSALFAIALLWLNVEFLPLFITYAVTMLAFWLALPFTL